MDVAATGLVLLAFMGAGYDEERPGPYREVVSKGMRWLASVQDDAGWFGSRYAARARFSHVIATLAVAESFGSTGRRVWRDRAEKGQRALRTDGPVRWPWDVRAEPADDDALVTAWALLAMSEGRGEWSASTDPATVRTMVGLLDRAARQGDEPAASSRSVGSRGATESRSARTSLTTPEFAAAAALLARRRFALRNAPDDEAIIAHHQRRLAARPPSIDEARGSVDPLDWCFGIRAVEDDSWPMWAGQIRLIAVDLQIKDGCARGSFDPHGGLGRLGGRTIATALSLIAIELRYFRGPQCFGR